MKSVSLLSLTAAMILCVANPAFAQTVTGTVGAATGTTVDGGSVDTSLDTNADGTVDADETSAGVKAGASVDLTLDTNGDGTVDDEEAATGQDPALDTNGDGTISAEEAAAGQSDDDDDTECSTVDFGTMAGADGIATIEAATTAQIVELSDCSDNPGETAIDSAVEAAVFGNQAIAAMLSAEGVGGGELLGVSVAGDSVTVYVENNEDDNQDDSDDAASGTTTAQ